MVPAMLAREVDGFVLNRLQAALLGEAFRLAEDGIASIADIDATIRDGLGLRWAFMGPFETIDLNAPGGLADYCARYGASLGDLLAQMTPRPWSARAGGAPGSRAPGGPCLGRGPRRAQPPGATAG